MKEQHLKKYAKKFSEIRFWQKLSSNARLAGIKVSYSALLMFYAYNNKETPAWAKRIVLGLLGYLISPIDAIPDLTPILGYTDDLGMLSFGLVTLVAYIDKDVREKARAKLRTWFGDFDLKQLEEIDKQL